MTLSSHQLLTSWVVVGLDQVDIGGDISSATEETSPKQQHREKERKTHDVNYINDDKNGNGDKSQHAEILHKSCKVNINGQQEI